jgi:hypothetical protein
MSGRIYPPRLRKQFSLATNFSARIKPPLYSAANSREKIKLLAGRISFLKREVSETPLTPALSRRERGKQRSTFDISATLVSPTD